MPEGAGFCSEPLVAVGAEVTGLQNNMLHWRLYRAGWVSEQAGWLLLRLYGYRNTLNIVLMYFSECRLWGMG